MTAPEVHQTPLPSQLPLLPDPTGLERLTLLTTLEAMHLAGVLDTRSLHAELHGKTSAVVSVLTQLAPPALALLDGSDYRVGRSFQTLLLAALLNELTPGDVPAPGALSTGTLPGDALVRLAVISSMTSAAGGVPAENEAQVILPLLTRPHALQAMMLAWPDALLRWSKSAEIAPLWDAETLRTHDQDREALEQVIVRRVPALKRTTPIWSQSSDRIILRNAIGNVLLRRFAGHAQLSDAQRRDWDDALNAVHVGYACSRTDTLDALFSAVTFDPGPCAALRSQLSTAAFQELLAGCPGVPAGRLRLTSVTAARTALSRQTPSWTGNRHRPAFAKLLAGDSRISLQQAIGAAIGSRNGEGLKRRAMTQDERLEAFLQTAHLNLRNPLQPTERYDQLPDHLLVRAARRVVEQPSAAGVELLRRLRRRLPPLVRAAVCVVADSVRPHDWMNEQISRGTLQESVDARGTTLQESLLVTIRREERRLRKQGQQKETP